MDHLPRKDGRKWAKFLALRPSALVIPALPPIPVVQAPAVTSLTLQVHLKSLMTLGEDYSIVKGLGSRWEKFPFHSFVPPLTAKNESLIRLSWHICVPFWTNVFLSVTGREASCGVYLCQIHSTVGFSLRFVYSESLFYECLQQRISGGGGVVWLLFLLSLQPPSQTPRLKGC